MTSNRAYSDAIAVADALTELERCAGSQFDAELVLVFGEVLAQPSVSEAAAA
jgi:HD-GYP domain-containing protein (c-di-GMP phosphodiesterase class II)